MLVLADAGFYFFELLESFADTGAHLAWRVGASVEMPLVAALADGSYTAPEANPDGELVTVITTVTDPHELGAVEAAASYAQRWEHESALGEVKTRLSESEAVLSLQSPPMVIAHVRGLLLAHYAVRSLMCRAANGAGYDPDRMGFTHAVRVVRRDAEGGAAFSPRPAPLVTGTGGGRDRGSTQPAPAPLSLPPAGHTRTSQLLPGQTPYRCRHHAPARARPRTRTDIRRLDQRHWS